MNEIVGRNVLLEVLVDGEYIPYICCTGMSISITLDLVNVTTISSGRWNDYRSRRADWELSVSGVSTILGDGRTIFNTVSPNILFTKYTVRLTFTDEAGNNAQFIGDVLLKGASIDGEQDQFSQWENGLQGAGPYQLLINSAPHTGTTQLGGAYLIATAVSSDQINLSWGGVANASGWRLYRNGINDFNSAGIVGTYGSSTLLYSDTGLSSVSTFYYWIVALGDGVNYTDADPVPAAATTLSTTAVFLLEWGWYTTDPYPAILSGGGLTVQGSKWLNHGDPLAVDTETMPQGYFLAVRLTTIESAKTVWFNTSFNNGSIPDTVFHNQLSTGGYNYYITRVGYFHDSAQKTILS